MQSRGRAMPADEDGRSRRGTALSPPERPAIRTHNLTACLSEAAELGEDSAVRPSQASKLHGLIQSPRRSPSYFIFVILNPFAWRI